MEAPGIEPRETYALNVAKRRETTRLARRKTTQKQREVSASTPMNADEAIRVAVKPAIDAGDLTRARALLDLLDVEQRAPPVAILRPRKSSR